MRTNIFAFTFASFLNGFSVKKIVLVGCHIQLKKHVKKLSKKEDVMYSYLTTEWMKHMRNDLHHHWKTIQYKYKYDKIKLLRKENPEMFHIHRALTQSAISYSKFLSQKFDFIIFIFGPTVQLEYPETTSIVRSMSCWTVHFILLCMLWFSPGFPFTFPL